MISPIAIVAVIPVVLAVMVTAGVYHHLEDEPKRIRRRVKAYMAITRRVPKSCANHAKSLRVGDLVLIVPSDMCKKCKKS